MNKKIKILHIIKTLTLGGAETNLLNLAAAFSSEKVENHVAYSFGGELEQRFRDAGLRLYKYADQSYRIKDLHTIPIVFRLLRYIRKHKIDVVHTHNFNGHIWGLLAAKLARVKLIEHVHDFRYTSREELARRHGLLDQYKFIKYFRNRSDRVIVLTRDNADFVITQGISSADKVVELQNGIPLLDTSVSSGDGMRAKFGIPVDSVVILTSARMDPTKNIDLILRIAKRVLETNPDVFFLIAGSGANLEDYRSRARGSGLEKNVRFIGFHADVYALLSDADIFLLPSFLELHSIAILEALKMKIPVVISQDVGCNGEFIESGVNGYLCDPFADQPWIDALVSLAGDPALRTRIGQAGYDVCLNLFDIRKTAASFEKVYAELAA